MKMKAFFWQRKYVGARLTQIVIILGLAPFLCSCSFGDSTASPFACGIRMQAQVALTDSFGNSQTHNLGGVRTSGTMISTVGNSGCTGTLTQFAGITDYSTGLNDNLAVQMNANWSVAWDYSNTMFSACGVNGTQGYVPDSGAIFNNVCNL